jgi:pimeloyl-ACP methyl ester carboxylesterase
MMRFIDVGSGPPVVVIPGIQGRWEWMKAGIDALASRCRVITFSLADERGADADFDAASGLSSYVEQVRSALDAAGIERAAICGVSYGGLIAAAFAATHPDRVTALVLVSAIPPSWVPDRRIRFYLCAPRLLAPLFCVASVRMYREIAAAHGGRVAGGRAAIGHAWTALTHMFSPSRMARRVHLLADVDWSGTLAEVHVPTLIVTGDPALDRVVPVRLTREYVSLWPHAQIATIERTGHLGVLTRPDEFTRIVAPFVDATAAATDPRRRVG